jgi:hypothetical protein
MDNLTMCNLGIVGIVIINFFNILCFNEMLYPLWFGVVILAYFFVMGIMSSIAYHKIIKRENDKYGRYIKY